MKKIILLLSVCFTINILHGDAQTPCGTADAAQIISGTYKGVVRISRYGKEETINQNASISVQKIGEGTVRVSYTGGKAYELQIKIESSTSITGFYSDEKDGINTAKSISLDVSEKPVKINGYSGNAVEKEGDEYWNFEAITNEKNQSNCLWKGEPFIAKTDNQLRCHLNNLKDKPAPKRFEGTLFRSVSIESEKEYKDYVLEAV